MGQHLHPLCYHAASLGLIINYHQSTCWTLNAGWKPQCLPNMCIAMSTGPQHVIEHYSTGINHFFLFLLYPSRGHMTRQSVFNDQFLQCNKTSSGGNGGRPIDLGLRHTVHNNHDSVNFQTQLSLVFWLFRLTDWLKYTLIWVIHHDLTEIFCYTDYVVVLIYVVRLYCPCLADSSLVAVVIWS